MYECVMIVEIINAIYLGSLNNMKPHLLNDFDNLEVFFGQYLYVSFKRPQTKAPASLPYLMQNIEPSPDITFIQMSKRHKSSFFANFKVIHCMKLHFI